MTEGQQPKIIVDSDWKSQAQAEKEKLSAKAAAKPERSPDDPLGFEDLVGMLATQALMYMGYFPDPQTGQSIVSVEYARMYLDMLAVLESKTKGNLSEPEQQALTRTTSQLRAEFAELSKAIAKAVAEGRIKPVARPGPAAAPGGPGQPPAPTGGLMMPP
jgi:hypothetical protein